MQDIAMFREERATRIGPRMVSRDGNVAVASRLRVLAALTTRRLLMARLLVIVLWCFPAACSSTSGKQDQRDGGDGGSADAIAFNPCPPTLPAKGASCSHEELVCEYGDDPNPRCRHRPRCSQGVWDTFEGPLPGCPSTIASSCPANVGAARDQPCTEDQAWCSWASGAVCRCTACRQGPINDPLCALEATWHCSAAHPVSPDCPEGIPRSGTPCSGVGCDYGCEYGGSYRCIEGIWKFDGENCPISTRAAKEDIHYLSAAEIEKLAVATEAMRLASYRYRSPAFGTAGRHLGFIIEDNPDVPAVSPSHQTVDLYGFTSMLLATTQAQARRLEQLEREVARLKAARSRR